MSKLSLFLLFVVLSTPFVTPSIVLAKEFKVDCPTFEDCMKIGEKLTKKRKLSLAQEAYRNAIKFNIEDKDAWRKFEILTVRISEEGGCG